MYSDHLLFKECCEQNFECDKKMEVHVYYNSEENSDDEEDMVVDEKICYEQIIDEPLVKLIDIEFSCGKNIFWWVWTTRRFSLNSRIPSWRRHSWNV